MNEQSQSQPSLLCPHLAAAALWMTKPPRRIWRGKGLSWGAFRPAMDDLAAL